MKLENGVEWECQRCGLCCKGRGDMTDPEGSSIGDCPHLVFDEKEKASCDVYEFRPHDCEIYPNDWAFSYMCDRMRQ